MKDPTPKRLPSGSWRVQLRLGGKAQSITAHNLRHGTATLCFEFGVDELTTQAILGHSRVEITREIYTDLRAKQLKKSVGRFDRGMQKKAAIIPLQRKTGT